MHQCRKAIHRILQTGLFTRFVQIDQVLTPGIFQLRNILIRHCMDVMTVQVWFNVYQCLIMLPILLLLWYPQRKKSTPFVWHWNIVFISVFLIIADWIYFYALTFPDSMISIVSMWK